MSTDVQTTAVDTDLRDAIEGKPLDPAAARRIQERAAQITETIRRTLGVVDDATFESLLEDE